MANIFGFAGLGVSFLSFIFSILSLALPYWTWTKDSIPAFSYELYFGLWRYCIRASIVDVTICGDFLEDIADPLGRGEELKGARAMAVLGFLCILGAMVSIGVMVLFMKDQKILGYVAAGLATIGGLFLMIAMAIYENDLHTDTHDHGFAFVFDIVGWLLSWISAVFMIAATVKPELSISNLA